MPTLDEAKEAFDNSPSDKTAGQYLRVAVGYAGDGMITSGELESIAERIAEWLLDE
jgi:hypothetical protein